MKTKKQRPILDADSTAPKPSMLRGMQHATWTIQGALSELIDNSFGQARGDAHSVDIDWQPKSRLLTVIDDGVGMSKIRDLFRLGETAGRQPHDIGEFGNGGTHALLWLAEEVEIWSLRWGAV